MGTSTKEEQTRVKSLLLDTVSLLCKNGLTFKKQMKIQGLLGITLDEEDVFIVHINEAVGDALDASKRTERTSSRECSSGRTPEKSSTRKRGAASSPATRGPPDKRQAGGDVIVIVEDDKNKLDKKPLITNVRGGLPPNHPLTPQKYPGMRAPGMASPNRMPYVRVVGSPNQARPLHPLSNAIQVAATPTNTVRPPIPGINMPRMRRQKIKEQRDYVCLVGKCGKSYYSMAALKLHVKLKHHHIDPKKLDKLKDESFKRKLVFTQVDNSTKEKDSESNKTALFKDVKREDTGGSVDFEKDFKPINYQTSSSVLGNSTQDLSVRVDNCKGKQSNYDHNTITTASTKKHTARVQQCEARNVVESSSPNSSVTEEYEPSSDRSSASDT